MQHKHVDVVSNEWHYLRLNLPPSKGHKFPITTMPWAVRVYERIVKRNAKRKLASPEDYVFMPEYGEKSRGHALKMLQYQFDALLDPGALIHYLEPLLPSPDWTDHMVNFDRITHEPGKMGSRTNVLDSEILSFAREPG